MKKFNIFIMLIISIIVLAACGSNDGATNDNTEETESNEATALEYEPEDIDPNTDVCEICAMAIADDQHATQIILKNDRSLKFDDLGCLYEWIEEKGEDDIGAKFVRDFHTEEWIHLEDATYIFDEAIDTPMAYGIISFKEQADAEDYIEENEHGDILTVEDLDDHKWEMMDHDHDHDHDHSHHNHHHDHADGFHMEGFDMHVTELENVIVSEQNTLEVHVSLDEAELEDADVRYEIWQESDRDNTDWVDAEEVAAGNYVADYSFEETGTYNIQVHVEDDEDLHEHLEYEVNVKE